MHDFANLLKCGKRSLMVGEGNFSFTVSLLAKYGSQSEDDSALTNELVTSCFQKYKDLSEATKKNARLANKLGAEVWFGVDATYLHCHERLKDVKFDFILFNFPHVGGKMKVHLNRQLLKNFFASASLLLKKNGRVLITLCQGQSGTPFDTKPRKYGDSWQVIEMASNGDLVLIDAYPFNVSNWPLYNCNGYRGLEKSFHLNGAFTFAFARSSLNMEDKVVPYNMKDSKNSHCCSYVESRVKLSENQLANELGLFCSLFGNEIKTLEVCNTPQSICLCQTEENRKPANWWELTSKKISEDYNIISFIICYTCWANGTQPTRKVILLSNVNAESIRPILSFLDLRCSQQEVNGIVHWTKPIHPDSLDDQLDIAVMKTDCKQEGRTQIILDVDEFLQLGINFTLPDVAFPLNHDLKNVSLHPPASCHHLCFWISDCFSQKRFACTLRLIAGEIVKYFQLIDEYECLIQKRKSVCYLIVYQSLNGALSSEKAFYLQTKVIAPILEKHLKVNVR